MLQAYHGDKDLKKQVVTEMAMHRKADHLVQDYGYWKDGKGCTVGCLLKSGDHSEYEIKFGIPRSLAYLEDRIFEGLTKDEARKWPERFLGSINPGADLSMVTAQFLYFILTDKEGIIKHASDGGKKAIKAIAELYKRWLDGNKPSKKEWFTARSNVAADADAAAAAYADADAAAAAYAVADAADAYAAYVAADAYAAYVAARKQYYKRMADKLIKLLKGAK